MELALISIETSDYKWGFNLISKWPVKNHLEVEFMQWTATNWDFLEKKHSKHWKSRTLPKPQGNERNSIQISCHISNSKFVKSQRFHVEREKSRDMNLLVFGCWICKTLECMRFQTYFMRQMWSVPTSKKLDKKNVKDEKERQGKTTRNRYLVLLLGSVRRSAEDVFYTLWRLRKGKENITLNESIASVPEQHAEHGRRNTTHKNMCTTHRI